MVTIDSRVVANAAVLLCMATMSVAAQVRRPPRPGIRTPNATSPPAAPVLAAFAVNYDSVTSGPGPNQPNGKVTLSGAAPTGEVQVTLTSDNPAVTIPALAISW